MPSYNSVRTAEAQPIGSAVPWVGALTSIPPGWLICNGQELDAADYPLLRRVLKNTYGGNSSGDFPNYSGTFNLPNISQKALADISVEWFAYNDGDIIPGNDQPTYNIDNAQSLAVIQPYIGPEGDVGTPGTVFALTDLNFSYTPDPDGTLERATLVSGIAAVTGSTLFFGNVPVQPDPAQIPPSTGTGASFNIIKNEDTTYQIARREKGQDYEEGDLLIIPGNLVGGTSPANDIFIQVDTIGNPFYTGTIAASNGDPLTFVPGFGIDTVNVVPRKLGRRHMPPHTHLGQYDTLNTVDNGTVPGRGVGVWSNPQIDITEYWFGRVIADVGACPFIGFTYTTEEADVGVEWGDSRDTGTVTEVTNPFTSGVGRYALGSVSGTPPAKTHTVFQTGQAGHGIAKPWFDSISFKLRDATGAVSTDRGVDPGVTIPGTLDDLKKTGRFSIDSRIPYSDNGAIVNSINYDLGIAPDSDDTVFRTEVMFNNAADSFTRLTPEITTAIDVIIAHDHQGEINITYNNGSLNIPGNISSQVAANINPDSVPNAFQITFTCNSANLTCLTLIRAY